MDLGSIHTDPNEALHALEHATVAFADAEIGSDRTIQLGLRHLMEVTGADAGAVAVPDENREPVLLAQRSLASAGPLSRTALAATLQEASPQATITEPPASSSVAAAHITSILCTPVRRQGKTLAAVYLDRRGKPPFDEVARRLSVCFASVLALVMDLTQRMEQVEEQAEEARAVAVAAGGFWRFGAVLTHNRRFAERLQQIERVASSDVTMLLLGETGAGKEHIARCIHAASPRRGGAFITINCAAIPETLLESELFGHEKGAFTGAVQTRRGKFELAHGGTLFLDEIGELPLSMQPKLLRVLEDRRVSRLGGTTDRVADVRILAATNRDLAREVREGRFREDLYYRLNIVEVTLPPLRERVEDIPFLAQQFLELAGKQAGRELSWDAAALRRLSQHAWPGNVRELRNAVERLSVLAPGPRLSDKDIEAYLFQARPAGPAPAAGATDNHMQRRIEEAERTVQALRSAFESFRSGAAEAPRPAAHGPEAQAGAGGEDELRPFHELMDEAARQVLRRAIRKAGSISAAARQLGLSRQHLSRKCKSLGLTES
jgi:transcriptional regulator with GAF, ATPase, and Fis domain